MRDLLLALRPYQWSKNLLVLAALVFALDLFRPEKVLAALAGVALFSAASSAVYLFNDICDRERDRNHPQKAQRPIAAGRVSVRAAGVASALLVIATLAGSFALEPRFGWVIVVYFGVQATYSLFLRNVAIIDVLCVASGFLLRVIAGAEAIREPVSSWLLICTIFLSVFISFAKRRHEISTLAAGGTDHRQSLSSYDLTLLDQLTAVSAASSLISYALYTTDPQTVEKFDTDGLVLTLPFVIYGIFRYLALVQRSEEAGDPSMALFKDRPLLITVMLWGLSVVGLLYVG